MAVIPFPLAGADRAPAPEWSQADAASLLAKVTAGDATALDRLMRGFWRPLTAYASRLLNDNDLAYDVVQDVFVRLWTRRSQWRAASVRALLFTLTRNAAMDELRRRNSRTRVASFLHLMGPRFEQTPAELLEREELRRAVDRALQTLPERRREVFDLVYLRSLSYREAAEVMGISPKTVGNQMTAALNQLRRLLRPLLAQRVSAH